MEVITVKTEDLIENDIIASDLYVGNCLLLTRGSTVTDRIISSLRRQEIKNVQIYEQLKTLETIKVELMKTPHVINQKYDLPQTLHKLNARERYGKVLSKPKDVVYINELFTRITQQPLIQSYLSLLQQHDFYTFLHALDVFILTTLFAKKEGISQVEDISVGFMMHDIGKLRTPVSILHKTGKLSKAEFKIMQEHTIDGYSLLHAIGMGHIAYLAKQHHERMDRKGYPDGLSLAELRKEVQLLQLVDIYSALTMKRSYKTKASPVEAIIHLFQDETLFDKGLLERFTQFIGIYPENSIVLLSNGSHAVVERINEKNPHLPVIKEFQTGQLISLEETPLTISKLLSYSTETSNQFFAKLSEFLINGRKDLLHTYLEKLKDHYRTYEWYTHIHIPLFKVINVLNQNNLLKPEQVADIKETFIELLKATTNQLRELNKSKESVILVWDRSTVRSTMAHLLEGLFYSEEISTIIIDHTISQQELEEVVNEQNVKRVFMVGRRYDYGIPKRGKMDLYHISEQMLETFLYGMANECLQQEHFEQRLEKYKVEVLMVM